MEACLEIFVQEKENARDEAEEAKRQLEEVNRGEHALLRILFPFFSETSEPREITEREFNTFSNPCLIFCFHIDSSAVQGLPERKEMCCVHSVWARGFLRHLSPEVRGERRV
jgi:hypothetical protein